jgi:excisionase family DNA binding protein
MIAGRRIPFVRVSNRVRFLRSDVNHWLESNRIRPLDRA